MGRSPGSWTGGSEPPVRDSRRSTGDRRSVRSCVSALLAVGFLLPACSGGGARPGVSLEETGLVPPGAVRAEDLLVVDCLLPGQVRKLGRSQVFLTPRRPLKTSASECEIRGGEYVAYDRADYRTALSVWLVDAKQGDPKAQTYAGEIYEKGLGVAPDYAQAAEWYEKAAAQGFARAMMNLGALYESGRGVPRDPARALAWYRRASGLEGEIAYSTPAPGAEGKLAQALAAPSIQLIEPPIPETRGIVLLQASLSPPAPGAGERTIVGRVYAPAGLVGLVVNDRDETVDDHGLFRVKVPLRAGSTEVVIAAIDANGRRTERRVTLRASGDWQAGSEGARPAASERAAIDFGRYHALVIGNTAYRHLPRLRTAGRDAEAVARTLSERYGFQVTLLHDATRYDVLSSLNRLRAELGDQDNLLVYYAGHGELDQVNMRGHWLPVDAERDSTANWISNVAITDILNAMNARHVMVVSDSCYSGSLTRSGITSLAAGLSDEERRAWLAAMTRKRSRTALTSGGLAPVLDAGGGEHSVFASAFLDVLQRNGDVLEGQRLFQELSARVTFAAESYDFEQLPQYAPIKYAGHEAGDFFLVARQGGS